ncbi:ABC transporter substrate-binding protein [Salinispirillum marinum]|uniref:ABC transporter substrate-binding protein n=2 Tax=Saccharospirillaceae TaxID=255527 RepID=A0ABV8BDN5_9GAMM
MKKTIKTIALAGAMSALLATGAMARTLIVNSDQVDPAPKAAFAELLERFKAENPDIDVQWNDFEKEGYKTAIRGWLASSPPDIAFWYAGERMKFFVDRGLFADVSDIWQENNMLEDFASVVPAMSVDGKQYGVPFSYYQWGIYYNKDVFDRYGLSEPSTWDEFMAVNATLKENGVTPITIGTRFLWTAAGWFDYLNLRVNGLDYHIDLMEGKIPYDDAGVREVFNYWGELVNNGYFIENHAAYTWQEAQPFLFNGEAAMYLMGNFLTPNFPDGVEFGFFPFPQINPEIGMYEDAPLDTIHMPTGAKNKEEARLFLEFVARADNQALLNGRLNQLAPNSKAEVAGDAFLQDGARMLAAADGTAQFYDRDTLPEMASVGMQGFQEFMVNPDRLDAILTRLERTRARIYRD